MAARGLAWPALLPAPQHDLLGLPLQASQQTRLGKNTELMKWRQCGGLDSWAFWEELRNKETPWAQKHIKRPLSMGTRSWVKCTFHVISAVHHLGNAHTGKAHRAGRGNELWPGRWGPGCPMWFSLCSAQPVRSTC